MSLIERFQRRINVSEDSISDLEAMGFPSIQCTPWLNGPLLVFNLPHKKRKSGLRSH